MQMLSVLLALATVAVAHSNTYRLKTELKPGQANKAAFNNLYLSSYHTGAGLSDVVFTTVQSDGEVGYLGKTNITGDGKHYYNQIFNLSSPYPYGLVMEPNVEFYADWQPVALNIGATGSEYTVSGFFMNSTGLQWTSSPDSPGTVGDAFGGWFVCNWWHAGLPQLFFKFYDYTFDVPSSCANVYLKPEYV